MPLKLVRKHNNCIEPVVTQKKTEAVNSQLKPINLIHDVEFTAVSQVYSAAHFWILNYISRAHKNKRSMTQYYAVLFTIIPLE